MSQAPQKIGQKMCKSPKSANTFQPQHVLVEKIEYENMNTNCTVVGSNNLNLVKKQHHHHHHQQQQTQLTTTNMSPAYSNPSPVGGYPPSPYSSPASLKSPSPSLKPPTPQPNYPVMQIIHNSLMGRPSTATGATVIQATQPQTQNVIKLKPHLNILPKPSASPQPSPKPSVSPQIVIPTNQQATIMPTAQPLLINQMPMLTAPAGVQFILRPQTTTKIPTAHVQTPQGLILQPSGQPLLQIQPPRSQPMVRVLTNGMQLAPTTTTYVTQMTNPQVIPTVNNVIPTATLNATTTNKKKSKNATSKVKKKLDLANLMKLSGIGDEDDIQFESDTSQSESEHNSMCNTPQPQSQQTQNLIQSHGNLVQDPKKLGNIQISGLTAQPTLNTTTPVVQVLNQNFQSGVMSSSAGTGAIPFNPFIAPNFTINNGLMVQRSSGGFKLTVGEDGRLVLQHDPTLNQDLQSQLILQSIIALGGGGAGLVLQPSTMDQQTIQQQTVQTIQQQSVQTIQQQTVQSQTIQTVQQALQPQIQQQTVQQTIQHQTVSQPLALQQPLQIVQPQQLQPQTLQPSVHHSIQSQVHSLQSHIQGQIQSLLQNQAALQQQQQQQVHHHHHGQPTQQTVHHQQQVIQPHSSPHPTSQVTSLTNAPPTTITTANTPNHHQPVLKVQPFQQHKTQQPPVQTVHPQVQQQQHHQEQPQPPPPTSYVVNLTPEQLEQLKRNGQLTVNGQTIFMQRPKTIENEKKLSSPKSKPIKKATLKQHNNIVSKSYVQDESPPHSKIQNNINANIKHEVISNKAIVPQPSPQKHILPHQQILQPQPTRTVEPTPAPNVVNHISRAVVQPSQHITNKTHDSNKCTIVPKLQQQIKHHHVPQQPQQIQSIQNAVVETSNGNNQIAPAVSGAPPNDVECFLGQLLEDPNNTAITGQLQPPQQQNNNNNMTSGIIPGAHQQQQQQQRIHTIQLTPQKQQHLKSIQLQIQTLSARLTPNDTEMQNALKLLFAEQQKILASGKLLHPDKVFYSQQNNQLTIVNPPQAVQASLQPPPPPQQQQQQQPAVSPVSPVIQHVVHPHQTTVPAPPPTINIPVPPQPASHHHISSSTTTNNNVNSNTSGNQHIPNIVVTGSGRNISPNESHPIVNNHSPRIGIAPESSTECTNTTITSQSGHTIHHTPQQNQTHLMPASVASIPPSSVIHNRQHVHPVQPPIAPINQVQLSRNSLAKKSHLIEAQLTLDQSGAVKPDIHSPFKDKKDACVRLIRYHCMDQPVLSQKDLDKADEIFELTARHFIGKYARMVDKYKYLLMKESMRQVQTSELMMLDRMFLAEEQQSLLRLRQDIEEGVHMMDAAPTSGQSQHLQQSSSHLEPPASILGSSPATESMSQEEYDEWACIQKELGCLPPDCEQQTSNNVHRTSSVMQHHDVTSCSQQPNIQPQKRTASSDSRLETLKRFRVDKHTKVLVNKCDSDGVNPHLLHNSSTCVQSVNSNTSASCSGSSNNLSSASTSAHHHHSVAFSPSSSFNDEHRGGSLQQRNSGGGDSCSSSGGAENNSIDEQVQSAIDSILNLQQNTPLDLDSILS